MLKRVFAKIDEINAADKAQLEYKGEQLSAAQAYSRQMLDCLAKFEGEASDELKIACYAQHVGRFLHPRSEYPMDRAGYLKWRRELGKFHRATVAEILESEGAAADFIERVTEIMTKENIKDNAQTQTFEDCACLVFLEFQYDDFIAGQEDEEKIVKILTRTWGKMSAEGHDLALQLPLHGHGLVLVKKALGL